MVEEPLLDCFVNWNIIVVILWPMLGVGGHVRIDAVIARLGDAPFSRQKGLGSRAQLSVQELPERSKRVLWTHSNATLAWSAIIYGTRNDVPSAIDIRQETTIGGGSSR